MEPCAYTITTADGSQPGLVSGLVDVTTRVPKLSATYVHDPLVPVGELCDFIYCTSPDISGSLCSHLRTVFNIVNVLAYARHLSAVSGRLWLSMTFSGRFGAI